VKRCSETLILYIDVVAPLGQNSNSIQVRFVGLDCIVQRAETELVLLTGIAPDAKNMRFGRRRLYGPYMLLHGIRRMSFTDIPLYHLRCWLICSRKVLDGLVFARVVHLQFHVWVSPGEKPVTCSPHLLAIRSRIAHQGGKIKEKTPRDYPFLGDSSYTSLFCTKTPFFSAGLRRHRGEIVDSTSAQRLGEGLYEIVWGGSGKKEIGRE